MLPHSRPKWDWEDDDLRPTTQNYRPTMDPEVPSNDAWSQAVRPTLQERFENRALGSTIVSLFPYPIQQLPKWQPLKTWEMRDPGGYVDLLLPCGSP
jgi:hypothetical protein